MFEKFKYEAAQSLAFRVVLRLEDNLKKWRRYQVKDTGELSDRDKRSEVSKREMIENLTDSLESIHEYIQILEYEKEELKKKAIRERKQRQAIEEKLNRATLIHSIDKTVGIVANNLIGNKAALPLINLGKERRRAASLGRAKRTQPNIF